MSDIHLTSNTVKSFAKKVFKFQQKSDKVIYRGGRLLKHQIGKKVLAEF